MRLVNESLLDCFRGPGVCDVCGKRVSNREPHHILCKGMGSASRIDHPWNILATCAAFSGGSDCHARIHMATLTVNGRRLTREDLWEIVSRREGVTFEEVENLMFEIKRAPKGADVKHAHEAEFGIWLRNTMFPGEHPVLEWIRLRLKTSSATDRIQFRVMTRLRGLETKYDDLLRSQGW
jgi:hypothetical protein